MNEIDKLFIKIQHKVNQIEDLSTCGTYKRDFCSMKEVAYRITQSRIVTRYTITCERGREKQTDRQRFNNGHTIISKQQYYGNHMGGGSKTATATANTTLRTWRRCYWTLSAVVNIKAVSLYKIPLNAKSDKQNLGRGLKNNTEKTISVDERPYLRNYNIVHVLLAQAQPPTPNEGKEDSEMIVHKSQL